MKKFTYLTIAALASSMVFTSCGGGEETDTKDEEEVVEAEPTALSEVQQLADAVKSGDLVLGTTSEEEAEKMLGSEDVEFEGYKLTKSFNDYGKGLESVRYSTFYDEGDLAEDANKEVKEYLTETLGEPFSESGSNTIWKKDGLMMELSTYSSSGYDFSVEVESSDEYGSSVEEVNNVVGMFTTDAIKLGTTTKEEIGSMLNMEVDDYYMDDKIELDDNGNLYVNRSITLTDGKVDNVKYSTFGDSESSDQESVKQALTNAYGEPTEDGSKLVWSTENGYQVSMSTYSGSGYDLYFEKP